MTKVTLTRDEDRSGVALTAHVGEHSRSFRVNDYDNGKKMQDAILKWAKPYGGTEI